MPTYTTTTKLAGEIPPAATNRPVNPATETEYTAIAWAAKLAELIAECSAEVDDAVGTRYAFNYEDSTQKFPNIDADDPTPSAIEKITRYLVAYNVYGYYGGNYLLADKGETSIRERYRKDAEALLEKINPSDPKASPRIVISLAGTLLISSFMHSENDRTNDRQDEAIFNPDDLDAMI